MHGLRPLAVVLLPLTGAACAVAATIQRADQTPSAFEGAVYGGETHRTNLDVPGAIKYRLFHQGSTGFISVETIRESAQTRAKAFCSESGSVFYPVEETISVPPHILGNWPRIEIIFSCVPPNPVGAAPAATSDKYDRLTKLKALLDNGAITPAEFENEKAKILSGT
jgi:hypothetical protein